MILRTKAVCKSITAITKARLFKDVKVGHIISFALPLKSVGHGRSGMYAPNLTVKNETTNQTESYTLNPTFCSTVFYV